CFLFLLLFVLRLVRFLVVFLLIFLFVGRFFFVALGFERRSFIRFQRDGEDAVGGIVVETLIELADARIEVAGGNEIKILPVVVEYGVVVAIEAGGNFGDFLGAEGI